MKILCLCNHGNNRSVHLAHHLKYLDHDVLAAGLEKNSPDTLKMLYDWAEIIIVTEHEHIGMLPDEVRTSIKLKLFDVGPDTYKRPFNEELKALVKQYLKENESWLKPQKNG